MRLLHLICVIVVLHVSPVHAGFIGITGTQHISATASDEFGTGSFTHTEALVYTDSLLLLVDNAYSSPSELTWAGAGIATFTISSTLIDITANVMGHTSVEFGAIEALAEVSLTFTVETSRLVTWDWLVTGTAPSSDAAVLLTGPDGAVDRGRVTLTPGVYTITAHCSFDEIVAAGGGTIGSGFQLYLEQVPAPGSLGLLAIAGLVTRSRRRR